MFRFFPRSFSNAQIGLLVLLMAAAGGACLLYNAWRLGKLPWKPAGAPNPRLVCLVVFLGIVLAWVLMALAG